MEKITKIIDFIFAILFFIITAIITFLVPAATFYILLGIDTINDKLFHNDKFENWIEGKIEKHYLKYFKEDIEKELHSKYKIRFSRMFCGLCKSFLSTKGCIAIVECLYYLKARDNDYDILYETAIDVFNN